MQIYIRGKNLHVSAALNQYVQEKIGHLVHYFEHIIDAHVTMRTEKDDQIVDVTVNLPNHLLKAEERSANMYAAIDLVRDRLEQQIVKYKTKLIGRHHHAKDAPSTNALG